MVNEIEKSISSLERVLSVWEKEEEIRQENIREFNKYSSLKDMCIDDTNLLKRTLSNLETFYSNHKISLCSELCNELNSIINMLFKNNYDFEFRTRYVRQNIFTDLYDSIRDGVVEDVCGGAVKQTIPFLSTISIIKQKGSGIAWLDESFSNFGVEEIEKIPNILNMISDIQIIFTEHKLNYDIENINIIEISRENTNSSSKPSQITYDKIEHVKEEINNKEIIQDDLNILEVFNKK